MAYRNIEDKIWHDPKFKALDPSAKLLFLYLITNAHSHLSGIYYLPRVLIQHETKLTEVQLGRAIDTLSIEHLAKFDDELEVVWVVNMLRYQGKGGKIAAAAAAQLDRVHNSQLIQEFLVHYADWNISFAYTPSIPHRSPIEGASPQDQDQDQEQEQSREGIPELNREGREDSPLKSSGIQTRTETQTAAGFIPPEPVPAPPRQHPEAMIRDMALTRDVPWDQVLERAGGPPPWAAHTVTELRAWLQPLPRFTEAQLDQRRASRRQRDGPPGQPVHVGEVAQRIRAETGDAES